MDFREYIKFILIAGLPVIIVILGFCWLISTLFSGITLILVEVLFITIIPFLIIKYIDFLGDKKII